MTEETLDSLLDRLALRIGRHASSEGDHYTEVPGLTLSRRTGQTVCYRAVCQPCLAICAQGKKRVELGGVEYMCTPSAFFLSSIDVPIQSYIVGASAAMPLLSMSLALDLESVRDMLQRDDFSESAKAKNRGLAIGELTSGIVSACIRLVELLETPEDIPHLHPLIQREIVYRILRTPQAKSLRAVVTQGDLSNRTTRAMSWIRANFNKPLRMEDLADIARMGVSTLHHQFRALTSMSPLQYQKHIRLQTARERMLMDNVDATSAAFEVGYTSVSQFTREYSRQFGMPPMRDVKLIAQRKNSPHT